MDQAKKKQIKKITTWVLLAALVIGLAAMPLLAKDDAQTDGPVASILSGTVEEGSVSTAIHGGGTLTTEGIEDVIIPTGVKITEFLVKNGDTVTVGTPLAAVDKVSVMTAITAVTETMEYLQKEIRSAKDEKVSSTISATAGGRVKKVFAQKGDNVQDVMLRDGALALLSLDGLMAVKIEKKMELPTGQSVTVTLSDGSDVSGRVESNLDGVIVITVEDKGYAIGQTVTVAAKDGDEVGSGELYVHNAWSATAYSGTIQNVQAKEESKVSSGSTLFTLTDTDFKAQLEFMSSLHREYEELMQDLFKMYNSGTIDAPCDGTISGIDKDSPYLLSSLEGSWQITLLNHIPEQSFVAFAARVSGMTAENLTIEIDPSLIRLESLYNLVDTPVEEAAMTQHRTYPADTEIYTQNASGAMISGGTAAAGDKLLFVGDESGVLWVVNLEQSVSTVGYTTGNVKLELLSDEAPAPLGSTESICDPNAGEDCPETNADLHDPNCLKACQSSTSCSATGQHYLSCIKSCSGGAVCSATQYHVSDCIYSCNPDAANGCNGTKHHKNECIKSCVHASVSGCGSKDVEDPHYLDCIYSCVQSDGTRDCPSLKHWPGCIECCTHADTADACSATTYHYTDCIRACITSDSGSKFCPATKHYENCFFAAMTYKAKVALVTDVGSSELIVRWDASGQDYDVEKTASGWKFAADAKFNADLLVISGKLSISNPSAYKKGDVIFVITGYKGTNPAWGGVSVYTNMATDTAGQNNGQFGAGAMSGLSGLLGGMMGGLGGFGNAGFSAASPVEDQALFDLNGSVLMTVSPETSVSLTITLDEQDIAKVFVGQKAIVKVEALSGQSFDAEVTEVSNRGTNSGGSSKFTAKLELPKVKDMLDGMSATASLPLEKTETVPTIPVAALDQQGTQTVVYTALDEKTGEPANPVPVTIGLSDGITAQILSGLEVGDTYYYSYYDVLELDTGVEDRFTLS